MRAQSFNPIGLNRRMPAVLLDFQRNFEEVVDCIASGSTWEGHNYNKGYQQIPQVRLSETKDGYSAEIDLPGMSIEKMDLELQENRLVVTGERTFENVVNKKGTLHAENFDGYFNCPIEFPLPVESQKASAEYKDGVLKVAVKKAMNGVNRPRKIDVMRK